MLSFSLTSDCHAWEKHRPESERGESEREDNERIDYRRKKKKDHHLEFIRARSFLAFFRAFCLSSPSWFVSGVTVVSVTMSTMYFFKDRCSCGLKKTKKTPKFHKMTEHTLELHISAPTQPQRPKPSHTVFKVETTRFCVMLTDMQLHNLVILITLTVFKLTPGTRTLFKNNDTSVNPTSRTMDAEEQTNTTEILILFIQHIKTHSVPHQRKSVDLKTTLWGSALFSWISADRTLSTVVGYQLCPSGVEVTVWHQRNHTLRS